MGWEAAGRDKAQPSPSPTWEGATPFSDLSVSLQNQHLALGDAPAVRDLPHPAAPGMPSCPTAASRGMEEGLDTAQGPLHSPRSDGCPACLPSQTFFPFASSNFRNYMCNASHCIDHLLVGHR